MLTFKHLRLKILFFFFLLLFFCAKALFAQGLLWRKLNRDFFLIASTLRSRRLRSIKKRRGMPDRFPPFVYCTLLKGKRSRKLLNRFERHYLKTATTSVVFYVFSSFSGRHFFFFFAICYWLFTICNFQRWKHKNKNEMFRFPFCVSGRFNLCDATNQCQCISFQHLLWLLFLC